MSIRRLAIGLTVLVAVFSTISQAQSRIDQAVSLARDHFRANAGSYGLSNPDRDMVVRSAKDYGDRVVIRFDQFYRDVPVFEGEAIARVSAAGVDVTNALRANLSINTLPGVPSASAVATAIRAIGIMVQPTSTSTLQILPQGQRSGRDVLVWHVHIENDVDPTGSWEYFVDARTGQVVWSFDSLKTQSAATTATAKTMYSGNVTIDVNLDSGVYSLTNPNQGSAPGNRTNDSRKASNKLLVPFTSTVPTFGDNSKDNTDNNTAGADAAFGLQTTWNFYQTTFGRNGIDGAGRRAMQRVHHSVGQNAFWSDSCFCMTYGDGGTTFFPVVAVDVAGHEMTHGVTANEANLTYSGESGGLNESTSDIFGSMVEFFANNAQDTPEYWIGERIMRANYPGGQYTETKALRYMDHPSNDTKSPNCWSATIGGLDVHLSSGPNNHMFYLLSHGGTSFCNSQVVAGIGNDKASRIWYLALTDFLTQSSNYHQARIAALNAATQLYGNGSPEYNATNAAFAAIAVVP
jgi:Zn-dependent metalloprotease